MNPTKKNIIRKPSTFSVGVEKLTPADAKKLLEKNQVNRKMRRDLVNAYRRDMESDPCRWEFTGEPIQISRTDRLQNGQHRLQALAGSKNVTSIDFVVERGLEDTAQEMMDQGKPRTVKDAMLIRHGTVKNATLVAAVCRWLVLVPEPGPELNPSTLRTKISAAEALEQFDHHPEVVEAAYQATAMRPLLPGSPSAVAYCFVAFHALDPSDAIEFFAGMRDMEWSWKNDPRKAALRRMQIVHIDKETPTSIDTSVMMVSVLTRAWNAWRRKEAVEVLHVKSRAGLILPVKPI